MKKASRTPRRRATGGTSGHQAVTGGHTLQSWTLAALPILDHFLQRMRLETILQQFLPTEDARTIVPTARALVVLVKQILLSREPLYAMSDWIAGHDPEALGLRPDQVDAWNDDRAGRALTTLFRADRPSLVLALMRHVVREFGLRLDELHNDSTTVTFSGLYISASEEQLRGGRSTPAITWGHNKDHRPDLKQLLYILTVTCDGGVPVGFRVASGNVTDDSTHGQTWDLLRELAGRRDFLYVADCKLATVENMNYIAQRGGRFVSVLPRTRREDGEFRQRVRLGLVTWEPLWEKTDDRGAVVDRYQVASREDALPEGYRLCWFSSSRKAELDLAARGRRLHQAQEDLRQLQERLRSPRTRLREEAKVREAVDAILNEHQATAWFRVQITRKTTESYRQSHPGRPSKDTTYIREESARFELDYTIDEQELLRERLGDGLFPLVTNEPKLGALGVLQAYKRQAPIERRFEQLKTDYQVAPVFLKDVARIEAFLYVYFFALLTESLIERALRQAMHAQGVKSLPMYPEDRDCRRPTARRLFDLFEPIQRHRLASATSEAVVFTTTLSSLHRRLLRLLALPTTSYCRSSPSTDIRRK
jgi:transposase